MHLTSVLSGSREYKTQRLAVQSQDAGNTPFIEHHGPSLPALWPSAASAQLEPHRPFKKRSLQEQELHVNKHRTSMSWSLLYAAPHNAHGFIACVLGGLLWEGPQRLSIQPPQKMPNLVPWQSLTPNETETCRQSNWGVWGGTVLRLYVAFRFCWVWDGGMVKAGSEGERGKNR